MSGKCADFLCVPGLFYNAVSNKSKCQVKYFGKDVAKKNSMVKMKTSVK